MAFLFDQDRFVASLKALAHPVVPSIVLLGIDTVQLAHTAGEIAVRRFNQKVLMIAHQAVSMTQPVVLLADFANQAKERRTIIVIFLYRLTPVTTSGHVVKRAGKFQSERSGHSLAPLVGQRSRLPINSAPGNH
ncbi:MAG: hypothetical protein ACRBBM_14530 [Pseudomonadaceae bacterium]